MYLLTHLLTYSRTYSGEPLNRLWSYYSPIKDSNQRHTPPPLPVMSKRVNNQQYVR